MLASYRKLNKININETFPLLHKGERNKLNVYIYFLQVLLHLNLFGYVLNSC